MSLQSRDNGNSTGSGFSQTGTVDWARVAASTIQYTVDVLSRFGAANVHPYTIKVAEALCSQGNFSLSRSGRDNISRTISGLMPHGVLGNLIWLGFGEKHFIRTMAETDEGLTCLALVGVIDEWYTPEMSYEIFFEMVLALSAPSHLKPSSLQWKAFFKACSGMLAKSDFGLLITKFMNLNPFLWHRQEDHPVNRKFCADPKSVAEVFQGMSAILRGSLKAITIIGFNDVAWLAAISEWLFDFKISIAREEGEELYRNCEPGHIQIYFVFKRVPPYGYETANSSSQAGQLQIKGRTYELRDAKLLLSKGADSPSSGRARWQSILQLAFGDEFKFLINNESHLLGTAIGSGARILQAIVRNEEGVPETLAQSWGSYVEESYGRGFIRNICSCLPELDRLRPVMERACNVSFAAAKTSYESEIGKLTVACDCYVCHRSEARDTVLKFCRVVILETIVSLGIMLAYLMVDENLLPKVSGLEGIYHTREEIRTMDFDLEERRMLHMDSLGPFSYIISTGPLMKYDHLVGACVQIFTGQPQQKFTHLAQSTQGICAFMRCLEGLKGPLDTLNQICITTGGIEYDTKPFDQIVDDYGVDRDCERSALNHAMEYSSYTVRVRDKGSKLGILYEVKADNFGGLQTIRICPELLIRWSIRSRGLTRCNRLLGRCSNIAMVPDGEIVPIKLFDKDILVIRGNDFTRLVALAITLANNGIAVLGGRECVQCTLKACLAQMATDDTTVGTCLPLHM